MEQMLEEIKEIIFAVAVEKNPDLTKELDYDVEISEYGINSITFINITVMLEDKYDIEFEDEKLDIENVWTIRKLKEYVEERMN